MTALMAQAHFVERAGREAMRLICGNSSSQGIKKFKVLVVDDEEDVRICFEHLFRHPSLENYSVDCADSVNQAAAMMAANCYDVCILDYRLTDGTALT